METAQHKIRKNTGNMGKGRPEGAKNKVTAAVKEAITNAFEKVGGEDYLVTVAREDPRTFCTLLGKVLPLQVSGEDGEPLQIIINRYAD